MALAVPLRGPRFLVRRGSAFFVRPPCSHITKERCVFGQDSPVFLLFGLAAIVGAGVGFALWHGTLAVVVCSLLLISGLFFALIPGHGLTHIVVLWETVTGRGRKREK